MEWFRDSDFTRDQLHHFKQYQYWQRPILWTVLNVSTKHKVPTQQECSCSMTLWYTERKNLAMKLVSEIHRATSDSMLRWKLIILSSIKHDLGAWKWIIHLRVKNEKPEKSLLGTWPNYLVGKLYCVIMLVFLFMFYFYFFFMYYSSDHLLGVDALFALTCGFN